MKGPLSTEVSRPGPLDVHNRMEGRAGVQVLWKSPHAAYRTVERPTARRADGA